MSRLTLIFTAASLLLVACATNPVTGDKELAFVSETTELEIGREEYGPSRQMQGGDFNADPELTAYVSGVGQRLAAVSDRKLPYEFVVLNNSVPNAWALPGGKIAVNRGLLLELDNEAELAAVLGHEVVHSAARHGAKGMERGMLLKGAVTAAGMATSVATDDPGYAAIAVGGATLAANLINQRYGRDAEREADLYGMEYMARAGYDLKAAVTLQETFERLSSEQRQDWLSGLFASHPPSRERVDNNKVTARRLEVKGGKVGREPYQKAIAHLQKTKPAYDAYEEGVSSLKAADLEEARRLAQKALKMEPREARFHALLGDADFAGKNYKKALEELRQGTGAGSPIFRILSAARTDQKAIGRPVGSQGGSCAERETPPHGGILQRPRPVGAGGRGQRTSQGFLPSGRRFRNRTWPGGVTFADGTGFARQSQSLLEGPPRRQPARRPAGLPGQSHPFDAAGPASGYTIPGSRRTHARVDPDPAGPHRGGTEAPRGYRSRPGYRPEDAEPITGGSGQGPDRMIFEAAPGYLILEVGCLT